MKGTSVHYKLGNPRGDKKKRHQMKGEMETYVGQEGAILAGPNLKAGGANCWFVMA